jgi:hypothetical protein
MVRPAERVQLARCGTAERKRREAIVVTKSECSEPKLFRRKCPKCDIRVSNDLRVPGTHRNPLGKVQGMPIRLRRVCASQLLPWGLHAPAGWLSAAKTPTCTETSSWIKCRRNHAAHLPVLSPQSQPVIDTPCTYLQVVGSSPQTCKLLVV